jgi:hypothetical protein
MSSVFSSLVPFSVDLILGNKNRLVRINQKNMGVIQFWNLLFCPKEIAVLILQCEASRCYARGTSSFFPETDVLLHEFFQPNETVLAHNTPYSPPNLVE